MLKRQLGIFVSMLLVAVLTACAGARNPIVPAPLPSRTPVLPSANATFILNGPPPATVSGLRRPAFIDAANGKQLVVTVATVSGSALHTTTSYAIGAGAPATCAGTPPSCTLNTALPTGLDNVQITLEDAANRPLSQNSVSFNVIQGTNTIDVTLNPIVAAITSFTLGRAIAFGDGSGYSMPVRIVTQDAAGAAITGPGEFAAAAASDTAAVLAPLTIAGTDGQTTFQDGNASIASAVTIGSPSDTVMLFHAGGGGPSHAVLTDSANRSLSASASAVPGWLYVAESNNGSVELFDTNDANALLSTSIAAPNGPQDLAFANAGDLYVANTYNNTVTEYDTNNRNTLIATLNGLNAPSGVAFDPATGLLYVANSGNNSVAVFQTAQNALFTTITGANTALNGPNGVAIDSSHNLYVVNNGANTVTQYATGSMTPTTWNPAPARTFSANLTGPVGAAVNAGQLYVSNHNRNVPNLVNVYNASTGAQITAQTISLASKSAPDFIYIDPASGLLYIPLTRGTTIPVYQTNTAGTAFPLVQTITASSAPFGVALQ